MIIIYGLTDPRTSKVRYVGCTKKLKKRFEEHLEDNRFNKGRWIECLKKQGLVPGVVILEKIDDEKWQETERKWIKHFGRENLVNSTDGGEGVVNPSKETRRKRSESRKGKYHSKETRQKISELMSSPSKETRRRMSEAKSGKKNPMFGRRHSQETLRRMSESIRGRL